MKKTYLLITTGLLVMAVTLWNFNMTINNKGHYFVNGILCGIGISLIASQILILKRSKGKD
ncbi:MAG: hypothetical protein OJF59_001741 [Cytophagales bacterium]|jgi:uncharacterized membrane protein YiaA|nr:hypothetical protein [Bacteroidota bacterium]MBS1980661.1 hypothetical protein [Bacteroidota bacterium]WHZ07988.1 MAG: hypothetical protein OJF59_001741 [Cytophagales bacterium]